MVDHGKQGHDRERKARIQKLHKIYEQRFRCRIQVSRQAILLFREKGIQQQPREQAKQLRNRRYAGQEYEIFNNSEDELPEDNPAAPPTQAGNPQ